MLFFSAAAGKVVPYEEEKSRAGQHNEKDSKILA